MVRYGPAGPIALLLPCRIEPAMPALLSPEAAPTHPCWFHRQLSRTGAGHGARHPPRSVQGRRPPSPSTAIDACKGHDAPSTTSPTVLPSTRARHDPWPTPHWRPSARRHFAMPAGPPRIAPKSPTTTGLSNTEFSCGGRHGRPEGMTARSAFMPSTAIVQYGHRVVPRSGSTRPEQGSPSAATRCSPATWTRERCTPHPELVGAASNIGRRLP
jgi:hypothetical protein